MKRKLSVLAALLTAGVAVGTAVAASVVPTIITGASNTDKTCAVQFPGTIELKVDQGTAGTYTDGALTVTVVKPSSLAPTNANSVDFTASFKVVGVIVKDGVDGANRYDYLPGGITSDTLLTTPFNGAKGISHVTFCYRESDIPTAEDLTVTKTAEASYTRTFAWTIDKSADTDTVYSAGGGESGAATYTVAVTKDGGTDSDWAVSGEITVHNPNTAAVNGVNVSDSTPGGTCTLDDTSLDVPAQGTASTNYTCTFASNPGSGSNVAKATWTDFGSPTTEAESEPADYTFGDPTNLVNDEIDVTDTNGQSWHFTASGSETYSQTFTGDPAGTCTSHENTATITQTGQSDSATVQDCQGADLTVEKTASGTYDRECAWTIGKTASPPSQTVDAGKPATFNYTVSLGATCTTIKNVKVTGTITVTNPNDWEDITLSSLTDALDSSGACTVDTSPGLIIPQDGGSQTYSYSCDNASLNDTLNTATATWDATTYHTPNGSASGSANVSFAETLIDDCVDVSDNYAGSLGHFCTDASGNISPNGGTINYSYTFNGPAAGTCTNITNTATALDNSTPQVTYRASATVRLCSFKAPLTPGYWKNHAADSKSGSGHPYYSGDCSKLKYSSCSTNGPFAIQYLPQSLGTYVVSGILLADPIWNAMNCSISTDQGAIGCLAGHLLAAKLNIANGANPCINATIASADAFLVTKNYQGPGFSYTLTAAQRTQAINLKNALDKYNNGGGC